jgi:hypothetical protein
MPALSPTMTEGNIASWRVKEGDKFVAGDVLLEIETDKATMDVEAQDDGVLMKIMQGDGSKSVKVGARIAVIAEEGDDVSQLEMPAFDEGPKQQQAEEENNNSKKDSEGQETKAADSKEAAQAQTGSPPEADKGPAAGADSTKTERRASPRHSSRSYPLLPSVAHLVKEHGIEESTIGKITPTGPNGRLLKGDVLAYLGEIQAGTPAAIEERFEKLSHLDLSNIKVKKQEVARPAPEAAAQDGTTAAAAEELAMVTLPVSLAQVMAAQKKVQQTLGVFMPLSTFIARASEVANDELPLPAGTKPTADELFDQVLGLDRVRRTSSPGFYLPQITAIAPPPMATGAGGSAPASRAPRARRRADIIDILAGPARVRSPRPATTALPGISTGLNSFSLVVPKAEERRAKAFLERIKLVLEKEPGRLLL